MNHPNYPVGTTFTFVGRASCAFDPYWVGKRLVIVGEFDEGRVCLNCGCGSYHARLVDASLDARKIRVHPDEMVAIEPLFYRSRRRRIVACMIRR